MSQITGQAVAAQEAVGEIFLASLYQAETTLAAVEQINQAFTSTSERPALEAFHRTQRTRYLAWLSQIAMCGVAQILATMR